MTVCWKRTSLVCHLLRIFQVALAKEGISLLQFRIVWVWVWVGEGRLYMMTVVCTSMIRKVLLNWKI
ncbi:hypothetical protein CLJ08_20660 [Pseudomonas mosselii]|nr:hypothetical protein CLJ08_20660 [Pseudomonas mosselii]